MADLVLLKWSDIKGDRLVFTRQKTKQSGTAPIEIPLLNNLKRYLGTSGRSEYVIDGFNRVGTAVELRQRTKWYVKNINNRIKAICKANGIEPFTTYSARHTIASILKSNGVDISVISELFGHTTIRTTEAFYTKRHEMEKKSEAIKTIKI